MPQSDFLTAIEFMKLGSMTNSTILAGKPSAETFISRASVVENVNMYNYAQSGEVIITSGYALRDSPELLVDNILNLSEIGAAALCIKPSHFHTIPAEAIRTARKTSLLLIQLPIECMFSNLVHEVATSILQHKSDAFLQSQQLTDELINMLLENPDLETLLPHAEKIIHSHLLIFDNLGDLICSETTRSCLPAYIQEELIRGLYTHELTGRFRISYEDTDYCFHEELLNIENSNSFSLLLFQENVDPSAADAVSLKRIARILSLEIKNATALTKIHRKSEYRFLMEWLQGNFSSPLDICAAAESFDYHFSADTPYSVAIVNNNTPGSAFTADEVHMIKHIILQFDYTMVSLINNGKLILIFEYAEGQTERLKAYLTQLNEKVRHILNKNSLSFCCSPPCAINDVPQAYAQAMSISSISSTCGFDELFITGEKLGVLSLLSLLPHNAAVTSFTDRYLKPVEDYDAAHNGKLITTLSTYLECGCNTKLTAEKLYTHYNTIVYRLDKITALLNIDLSDSEVLFQLRLALKLRIVQPKEKTQQPQV